mgnify:CR=1 FL=1
MNLDFEGFMMQWEREFATTARVLGNLPPTALGFRPHPKSMTAGELAWHLARSERFFVGAYLAGKAATGEKQDAPPTLQGILQAFALGHQSLADQVRKAPEGWDRPVPFHGQELPGAVLLRNIMLPHTVHHRGQFTVYLRLLDAKVPAVYGPSADDAGR